ncbi:MAG: hypothetical protein AAF798_09730 [Bacteroidota bacterium]
MIRYILLLCTTCYITHTTLHAQQDSIPDKRINFFAVPLVFLTPETSWGFGAASVLSFKLPSQAAEHRPSQLQLGGAYTLNDQILLYLPFQFFAKQDRYNIYGELGYYRYNYFYYGIGNEFESYDGEL